MVKRIYVKKLPEINQINEPLRRLMDSFPEAKELHYKHIQSILSNIDPTLNINDVKPMGLIKIGLYYNDVELIVEGIQRGGKVEPFFFLFDQQNDFYQSKVRLLEQLLKFYRIPINFQYFFIDRTIICLYNATKHNSRELEKIKSFIKMVKLLVIEGKSKIHNHKFLLPLVQFSPFKDLRFLKRNEQLKWFFEIQRLLLYFDLPSLNKLK